MIAPDEQTSGSFWSVFGHIISGTIGAIAMQVVTWGREWRKDSAAVEETETDTAIKVVAEWRHLYEDQKHRADALQTRLDKLEEQLYREKRECETNIENLTIRVRELEKGLNFMSPQNPS